MLPVLALLAAALLWGMSFAAMRVALQVLNPWSIMWVRMAVAVALLAPFTARRVPHDLRACYRKGDWKLLALLVALGAPLFLGERMKAAGATGLALSIAGVAALTLLGVPPGSASAGAVNAPLGNALETGAMIAAAAYTLSSNRLGCTRPIGRRETRSIPMGFGRGACLPGQLRHAGSFRLLQLGLSRLPPARASLFLNLIPVIAVLLGWLLLGESLSAGQAVAAVAVVGGVLLGQGLGGRTRG